jgi:hypothetical protein
MSVSMPMQYVVIGWSDLKNGEEEEEEEEKEEEEQKEGVLLEAACTDNTDANSIRRYPREERPKLRQRSRKEVWE